MIDQSINQSITQSLHFDLHVRDDNLTILWQIKLTYLFFQPIVALFDCVKGVSKSLVFSCLFLESNVQSGYFLFPSL